MSSPENPTNQAPDPKAEGSTGQATNDGKANNRGNILIRFLLNIPSIFSGFFSRRASNFKVIMLGFAGTLLMGWGGFYYNNRHAPPWIAASLFVSGGVSVAFAFRQTVINFENSRLKVSKSSANTCCGIVISLNVVLAVLGLYFEYGPQGHVDEFSGLLQPANEPMPSFLGQTPFDAQAFGLNPDDTYFFMGGCMVITQGTNLVPLVRSRGRNLLELSITPKGASVSGEFFDKDGKLVAVIRTNRFVINRLNYFEPKHDRSSFSVRDQSDVEVVNIRWINRKAFSFSGTIRSPDQSEAIITQTNIIVPVRYVRMHDGLYMGIGLLDFSRTNCTVGLVYSSQGIMRPN
jgi:hypothetical protein